MFKNVLHIILKIFNISKNCYQLFGKKLFFLLIIGNIASILLAFIELSIVAFIQLLLQSLNIIASTNQIGISWIQNIKLSPIQLGLLIILIGILRAIGQFAVKISALSASQLANVKFKILLLYDMLIRKNSVFVSAAEANHKIGEIFPKTTLFIMHSLRGLYHTIESLIIMLFLLLINIKLFAISIIATIILGIISITLNKKIKIIGSKIPLQNSQLLNGIQRISKNWLLVKILKTGPDEYIKLTQNTILYAAYAIRANVYIHFLSILPPLIGVFWVMIILIISLTILNIDGLILVSFIYLFIRFLQSLSNNVTEISSVVYFYTQFKDTINYFIILKKEPSFNYKILHGSQFLSILGKCNIQKLNQYNLMITNNTQDATKIKITSPPKIHIQNLYYKYSEELDYIIKNLSATITEGSQFGIIGKSGSGKSTLIALILGIIEPQKGLILIKDMPIKNFYLTYHINIGYVGADPFLIAGSIKDNLTYGLSKKIINNLEEKDYWDALEKAQLLDLLTNKKDGLNFQITENADGLSSGQKQRLALARALLSKPQLLILDEATANLDINTESQIAITLNSLKGTLTTIIVSHRPGILKYADDILSLD